MRDFRGDDAGERLRPRIPDHAPADQFVAERVVVRKPRVLLDGEVPILRATLLRHAIRG
jgi:hypothetical protein